MRPKRFLVLLVLASAVAAPAQNTDTSVSRLQQQLDAFFDDPSFDRGFWGVSLQSMDSGEILYRRNADKRLMPASNMKLVTAVAAIERLGLDYKFKTTIASAGTISGGVLGGDLVVIGGADPTLGARIASPDPEDIEQGDPLATFSEWAEKLKGLGIRRISGDIVGDARIFDDKHLGQGWAWDYLAYGYAAPVGGLTFNENTILVKIAPAAEAGAAASVQLIPNTSYIQFENRIRTVAKGEDFDVAVDRPSAGNLVVLSGTVPVGEKPFARSVAVANPTLYFVTVLKEVLESRGIKIEGRPRELAVLQPGDVNNPRALFVYESPDLRYVLRVMLKISQNLYAETLVRVIAPTEKLKSFEAGSKQVKAVLGRAGIPEDAYVLADGSGLSRYNFLTADMLVRLLRFAYHRPYRSEFSEFLPVAGRDGSIKARLKGTAAENNVHAKTGSIGNVRSLSGYVRTRDGELVAFSMIANNFTQSSRLADYVQDSVLEYLANFSRVSKPASGSVNRNVWQDFSNILPNAEWRMRNGECGMRNRAMTRNAECGMRNAECGIKNCPLSVVSCQWQSAVVLGGGQRSVVSGQLIASWVRGEVSEDGAQLTTDNAQLTAFHSTFRIPHSAFASFPYSAFRIPYSAFESS
ncbi:MAG TPA: D-alanyl-D-alanine carboxypeptidase/D-alanyl-D-alanine-endopeptidase [Acidobacteriota bacterium]